MLNNYDNSLAIVVYSCFKNRDMWEYFSRSMSDYWGDRRFLLVLVTDKYEESEKYYFDQVIYHDSNWSGRMLLHVCPNIIVSIQNVLLHKRKSI